ncbi:MAG: FMN-binding glutamate synthase family protein, partial [Pseudomonadota bacterium]|nr:FMN-binding glutamate synthase family protein [Pseudomonadota bacterium]
MSFAMNALEILVLVFVTLIGVGLLVVIALFVADRVQTGDAVRRNYPVIGRFRHLFTELGD